MELTLKKIKEKIISFLASSKDIYLANKTITNILFIFLFLGIILWRFSPRTEDLGLNFFTEILGVFITFLIVDQIIQKREERKMLPQKIAAYEDVRLFINRFLTFWLSAYDWSVPEKRPKDIQNFFSKTGMGKIWENLYLESKPNVVPETTWWIYLPRSMEELQNLGDKILNRHNSHLDHEVYGEIHHIIESPFLSLFKNMKGIRELDLNDGFPRPELLSCYSIEPQLQDYNALRKIYEWCCQNYEKLLPENQYLKKVSRYESTAEQERNPPCMFPPDLLKMKIEKLETYRKQKENG